MPEKDEFWTFYWEMRLQSMETLGKRAAILAGSALIRRLSQALGRPLRVLELGCGEAQIVGALLDAHAQLCNTQVVAGVDYNPRSLATCRRDFPGLRFVEGDFTDPAVLAGLGRYDLLLLVNALHEVFSSTFSAELGEVDVQAAKARVEQALGHAVDCLEPGGWLLLFDGLEPPGDPRQSLRIRFTSPQARTHFDTFAQQYHPFQIRFQETGDPLSVKLSQRDFTRYITKSIFLGKRLWLTERSESYQYFTEDEFRAAFARQGLRISELRTLTVNAEKWSRQVQIETPGVQFPVEHIMITAQKAEA
jgi:SAM-dependent methyltransferase